MSSLFHNELAKIPWLAGVAFRFVMANEEAGGTEAFVHAQMAAQRAAAEDDGVDAERRQKFVESCTLKSHRYQAARSADEAKAAATRAAIAAETGMSLAEFAAASDDGRDALAEAAAVSKTGEEGPASSAPGSAACE